MGDSVEASGRAPSETPDAEALARLTLLWAMAEAVGRKGRRRMKRRLIQVADALERASVVQRLGEPLRDAAALAADRIAVARFIRPAVRLIETEFPDG